MNESDELTRAEPREPGHEPRGAGRGKLSTVLIIIIGALLVFALFEAFSAGEPVAPWRSPGKPVMRGLPGWSCASA